MKKTILSLIVIVGLATVSWGQLNSTLTFDPGNGSLGDTYTSFGPYGQSSRAVMGPFVPGVGQQPTGEVDYFYQAGPAAGTYYYAPFSQFFATFRDPGNGGEPYLYEIMEFNVNGSGVPTTAIRSLGFDQNGNLRSGSLEDWPEINATGYSVSYEGGGFGPGYGSSDLVDGSGSGEGNGDAESLNQGLTFEGGSWIPE